MSRVSPRAARIAAWIAVPAAIVASGVVVSTASYSAFSATTTNPTSNWTAGSVALTDDDNDTALFTATNLKPSSTGSKCIAVTSTGSLPAVVKLYGTGAQTTSELATHTNLLVEAGSGGSTSSCTGFTADAGQPVFTGLLSQFGSTATNYGNGLGSWATTGGATSQTRVYKFTYTVASDTPTTAQGKTASIGFTWEAQNS
ncbi:MULTISPECIES: hypothetical protein [unclassified Curtobacterium]|uniref:hypothetical protein n=1 Tax=unclassified Curtobacterium TaxID=257496 RepID=UPI00082584BA|nr:MULTISPECIES: hypothetical protein [unclassified Curtobacterium]WIA97470.1 hypothetical protein QOL16_03485 [Curtobacterium sp. MCBA15_004]WIB00791.1 hypothetical protein QOL15_03595 [Curtobacterium sp. MCBA15_012]